MILSAICGTISTNDCHQKTTYIFGMELMKYILFGKKRYHHVYSMFRSGLDPKGIW